MYIWFIRADPRGGGSMVERQEQIEWVLNSYSIT